MKDDDGNDDWAGTDQATETQIENRDSAAASAGRPSRARKQPNRFEVAAPTTRKLRKRAAGIDGIRPAGASADEATANHAGALGHRGDEEEAAEGANADCLARMGAGAAGAGAGAARAAGVAREMAVAARAPRGSGPNRSPCQHQAMDGQGRRAHQ